MNLFLCISLSGSNKPRFISPTQQIWRLCGGCWHWFGGSLISGPVFLRSFFYCLPSLLCITSSLPYEYYFNFSEKLFIPDSFVSRFFLVESTVKLLIPEVLCGVLKLNVLLATWHQDHLACCNRIITRLSLVVNWDGKKA